MVRRLGAMAGCVAFLGLMAACTAAAAPAPGDLDAAFGSGGTVQTSFLDSASASSLTIQPSDGKIVALGGTNSLSQTDIAIARYNSDGTLDSGFGASGKKTLSLYSVSDTRSGALALQSDGKLLVADCGPDAISGSDLNVERLTSDGSVDTTYGTSGIASAGAVSDLTPDHASDCEVVAAAVQPSDKLLVLWRTNLGASSSYFYVTRFDTAGSVDTGWASSGTAHVEFLDAQSNARSVLANGMTVQADGKPVVVSTTSSSAASPGGVNAVGLVRFNTDGTLDSGFGSGGEVVTTNGSFYSYGLSVAMLGDQILVGGTTNSSCGLWRYDSSGTLDSTFGTGGLATAAGPFGNSCAVNSMAIQSDGKIVGADDTGGNRLVRFDANGTVDTGFGANGFVGYGSGQTIHRIALQSDGKIVGAGSVTTNSGSGFLLHRWLSGASSGGGGGGSAPAVSTQAASTVTESSATFNGTVNPNGASVTACGFKWKKSSDPTFTTTANCADLGGIGAGTSPVSVHANLAASTFERSTSYDVQLFAANANGTTYGSVVTFTTASNAAPAVSLSVPDASTPIYYKGGKVLAEYSCSDGDGDSVTCSGHDVEGSVAAQSPIYTGADGTYDFTVTANDGVNPPVTVTHHYTVIGAPITIRVDSPVAPATRIYTVGDTIPVSYSCSDPVASGSSLACVGIGPPGTIASGGSFVANAAGSYTFQVTATDPAGNSATKQVAFAVQPQQSSGGKYSVLGLSPTQQYTVQCAGGVDFSGPCTVVPADNAGVDFNTAVEQAIAQDCPLVLSPTGLEKCQQKVMAQAAAVQANAVSGGLALAPGSSPGQFARVTTLDGKELADESSSGKVIAVGGGNVIAVGGGNVITVGAGNVVNVGSGHVIAVGAGHVIAVGGGNLVKDAAGNVIAVGGGNWKETELATGKVIASGNVIAVGGGNVIAVGGGNVIAVGGGNVICVGSGHVPERAAVGAAAAGPTISTVFDAVQPGRVRATLVTSSLSARSRHAKPVVVASANQTYGLAGIHPLILRLTPSVAAVLQRIARQNAGSKHHVTLRFKLTERFTPATGQATVVTRSFKVTPGGHS